MMRVELEVEGEAHLGASALLARDGQVVRAADLLDDGAGYGQAQTCAMRVQVF